MTEKTVNTIIIAGVRFRENWKVYDFDASHIDVAVGDRVIVDSERGPGFASVVRIRKTQTPLDLESPSQPEPVSKLPEIPEGIEIEIDGEDEAPTQAGAKGAKARRKILRKATNDDIAKEEKNREREGEAFSIAQDMIGERELPMKLIRVEYSFDASRATFFFFSENRVDFRELVKDLAYKLKSRIEMRQIGVRDVARMIGGFGPCGRELCCSSFLRNFEPVSIRMAKKQEMVLNPAKISGVCGRLLCCLSYEYGMYEANKKDLADMRQSTLKEKKEEERRIAEERREAEEKEKMRQEERRPQDHRRERQKETGGQKREGRPDKKKEQEKKNGQQPQSEQPRQRQQQKQQQQKQQQQKQQQQKQQQQKQQQTRPESRQQQEQNARQPQQEGEKPGGKKKKRRFWRKKKKQGQGEGKPPQAPNPQSG